MYLRYTQGLVLSRILCAWRCRGKILPVESVGRAIRYRQAPVQVIYCGEEQESSKQAHRQELVQGHPLLSSREVKLGGASSSNTENSP